MRLVIVILLALSIGLFWLPKPEPQFVNMDITEAAPSASIGIEVPANCTAITNAQGKIWGIMCYGHAWAFPEKGTQ